MSYPAVAPALSIASEYVMPVISPLGRLIRYRRRELDLTQWELSDRTERYGARVLQNTISRLESGAAFRIDNREQLESLARALGFEHDEEFIMAAYGPKQRRPTAAEVADPPSTIARIMREALSLSDEQAVKLDRFVTHVLQSPPEADGPSPEERIARFARELAERHDRPATPPGPFVS